jgi:uroporphyrinogen-III synthase
MHVLLTRAQADGEDMKAQLSAAGIAVSSAPLLSIRFEDIRPDEFAGASGAIATSRNGLRALSKSKALSPAMALPIFTVGPATSAMARDLGFQSIHQGPGAASDLVPVITAQKSYLGPGPLVHLAGDVQAFDLKSALGPAGVPVRQVAAYAVTEARGLAPGIKSGLERGQFNAVVLMSPRTARVWNRLTHLSGKTVDLGRLTHVCLSQAVADALQRHPGLNIAIAEKPNGEEILSLIRRLAAGAGTG